MDSEFQTAAHSSPLVRFLLMDDKGEKKGGLKLILVCVRVCACVEHECEYE